MARVSRPATSNKIHVYVVTIHDPNWDAFAHAAHASQLTISCIHSQCTCTYSVGRVTGIVVVV